MLLKLNYQPIPLRKKLITVDAVKTKDGTISYPIQVNVPLKSKEYAYINYYQGTAKSLFKRLIKHRRYKNLKDKRQAKKIYLKMK